MIEPGKLHRFPGISKRNGNTAGWCKLFDDGLGGCFGDWSSGFSENWQAKRDKPFSQSERAAFMRRVEEARKHAEAERQQQYADAAAKAASIWDAATPANDDHPYLVRKGIKANGARLHKGALVIPVRSGGELHSLQFIAEDGGKRFLSGGRITGGYFSIGTIKGAASLVYRRRLRYRRDHPPGNGLPGRCCFQCGQSGAGGQGHASKAARPCR